DADFVPLTELLTNGNDDQVTFVFQSSGNERRNLQEESVFFANAQPIPGSPDFNGFVIEKITLTVGSVTMEPDGTRDNPQTLVTVQGSLTFEGEQQVTVVPAPPSLVLGAAAGLTFAG